MRIHHQRQPDRNSCGPTVAAMLVNAPVHQVVGWLPTVVRPPHRQRRAGRRIVNIAELRRLLAMNGVLMGPCVPGRPRPAAHAIVRVSDGAGAQHVLIQSFGRVYDPGRSRAVPAARYWAADRSAMVAHHPLRWAELGKTQGKDKPRNPQDATLRNIRALKKRVKHLEATVERIDALLRRIFRHYG